MQIEVISLDITSEDFDSILNQGIESVSKAYENWLADKSKGGFYEELSTTIEPGEDGVYASELTCKIADKRDLNEEFMDSIDILT